MPWADMVGFVFRFQPFSPWDVWGGMVEDGFSHGVLRSEGHFTPGGGTFMV